MNLIRMTTREEENGLRLYSSGREAGFSLLEMMASIVILLVIVGGLVSLLSFFQQSYARTEVKSDMYENVRGAAELMEQEIGQAGLVNLPSPGPTLSAGITANAAAQTVNVSSTTSMFVGEQLLVDAGASNEELVTLAGVNAGDITAIFSKSHATGASLNVLGVFPNGIVAPGMTDGSTSVTEPGVSVLNLFGDINGDGSLVYVRYTCDTSKTPGTLTRSVTTITPGVDTIGPSQTVLSTLVPNPGGTPCFQYTTSTAGGDTFVTNVGITLSVQTTRPDPQTGQYATMTKSFLNFSPRNVSAGFEWANNNSGNTTRLQATPANVLSY
jgi:prepilin-type N-terminal cleavage/methylation domain-containing protein